MSFPERSLSGLGSGFADPAVDVRRYAEALRRSGWAILGVAVLVTVVVALISRTLPKTYQASAEVVYNPTSTVLQPTDAASIQRQLATFQSLVRTPTVEANAARQLGESRSSLDKVITSTADPNANLVTINATAPTAQLAAKRANSVAQAFLNAEQAMQNVGYYNSLAQLQGQIARLQGTPGAGAQIAALRDRISALQVNSSGTASELQIAESATPPGSASTPRPAVNAIIALFLSLLLGVLFVLGRDQLRPRFASPREIGRLFDLAVLAGIPYRRRFATPRRRRGLAGLEHEAYDALHATVRLLGLRDGGQRVLLITSATHGEGKTTVTASLGRSLARTGQRTLLISGDVRSPTLHQHLGLPGGPGLTECLLAAADAPQDLAEMVESAIMTAPGDLNLDLLAAGDTSSDPSSLVSGPALGMLMEAVRTMDYSYVLVDSPPFIGLGDGQFLARLVDDIVLVARLDRVTPEQAEDVNELMERLKLAPIGIVVIGAKTELSPYYLKERPLVAPSSR